MTEEVHEQHVEADQVEHVEHAETEPVVQEAPKPEWSDDDAEEARAFGWKSPDEWQGEVPAGYIDDPRRYLERAENFRPFKALKQKLETVENTYADRIRKLESVSETALKAQRAQYEREIESIRAQKRAAVDSADVEAYEALERREQSLAPPVPETPQTPQQDPAAAQALRQYAESDNGAWTRNPMLLEQGRKLVDAAIASNVVLPTAEAQFAYAEAEIRKMYPAYFPAKETTQKPAPQQRVDAGGLAGGAAPKGGGAFTKLPPEAKGAFKKFVAEGLFKDNEDDRKRYADDYNAA